MLNLNEAHPLTMLTQFCNHLDGKLVEYSNSYVLKVNNDRAFGTIRLFEIYEGVSAWVYDIKFTDELKIDMSFSKDAIYYFGYNLSGYQLQRFHTSDEYREIRQGQNFILKSNPDNKTDLVIPKDIDYKCCYIIIDPHLLKKNPTKSKQALERNLKKLISKIDLNNAFAYYGNIDRKTGTYAKLILEYKSTDVVAQLLAEAAVHNMLANQLKEFREEGKSNYYPNLLNERELLKVLSVGDYIKEHIDRKVSIKEISRHVGLAPKKIQDGSRFLYGTTINHFANRVRLEQARKLLADNNLTISEICYKCGYSSRSYFSKIFKDRYGKHPSEYRDSLNKSKMVYELSYQSISLVANGSDELENLVNTAKRMNSKFDITGCLIYYKDRFYQIIEGSKASISSLYTNLLKDSRHENLVVLWKGYKPEREFPDFSMAYINEDSKLTIDNKEFEFLALDEIFNKPIEKEIISERLWFKIKNLLEVSQN